MDCERAPYASKGFWGPLGMIKKLWVLLNKGTSAPLAQEMN